MVILAGIVINLGLGQNGIFNKAKQAKQNYAQSVAREKLETVLMEAVLEKQTNAKYNEEFLDNMLEERNMTVTGDSVIVDNYVFLIDREKLEILQDTGESNIKITKEVKKYKGKNENNKYEVEVLLKIESTEELKSAKIEKADGTQIGATIEELKAGKNIVIELDEEYSIIFITNDNKTQSRNLIEKSEEIIRTAQELSNFRDNVNSGLTYEGKTIKLGNDIDLSSVCGKNINGKEINWKPIGIYNSATDWATFYGTFNGQYNTIKNLYINIDENNIEEYDSEHNYLGLFGYNYLGIIGNLIMENVYIYVDVSNSTKSQLFNQSIGAVVGNADNAEIRNVGIESGNITSINTSETNTDRKHFIGGIFGESWKSNIYNSYNKAYISATNFEHPSSDLGTVNMIGGISGITQNSNIKNCYNTGNIELNNSRRNFGGGISGIFINNSIENSYNCGKITGTNSYTNLNLLGGIVGRNGNNISLSNKGTITNSYCTGASETHSFYEYNINNPKNDGKVSYSVLQGYSSQLGEAFTNDVQNSDGSYKYNDGLPILKWQIPENR